MIHENSPCSGYVLTLSQCLAFLVTVLAFASPSSAVPVLDQAQLLGTQANQTTHSIRTIGQTFTVGLAGSLDSIELILSDSGNGADLIFEILDNSGGDVSLAPSLGSLSIASSALGAAPNDLSAASITATLIDVSTLGIAVGVGDALAFRLSTARVLANGDFFAAKGPNANLYSQGSFFLNGVPDGAQDLAFKTFVLVPEPDTLTLMLIGGIALAGARRRGEARRPITGHTETRLMGRS